MSPIIKVTFRTTLPFVASRDDSRSLFSRVNFSAKKGFRGSQQSDVGFVLLRCTVHWINVTFKLNEITHSSQSTATAHKAESETAAKKNDVVKTTQERERRELPEMLICHLKSLQGRSEVK